MDSTLARVATVALDGAVAEEACPHDLAPTTSTTVALALGDALAVALLEVKGFRREDFAALHPGGSSRTEAAAPGARRDGASGPPARRRTRRCGDAVVSLAHDRGLAMVVEAGRLAGVLTTGDLTRLAERDPAFLDRPVPRS